MEDIFYMNKLAFSPKKLYKVIKYTYPDYNIVITSPVIGYMRTDIVIEIQNTTITFGFLDEISNWLSLSEKANQIYNRIKPETFIIITYRTKLIDYVLELLRLILNEFGGQIGCDDDWNLLYNVDTVNNLEC